MLRSSATERPARPALRVRLVGTMLLALTIVGVPLLGACLCGEDPPSIEGCSDPITDFSGITSMAVTDPQLVRGPQGGRHFQFEVTGMGSGLRGCVAMRYSLVPEGELPRLSDEFGVRSRVDGSTVRTTPVYSFLRDFSSSDYGPHTLRVEALGRMVELPVSLGVDPFRSDDAAEFDDAAAAMDDAASSDVDASPDVDAFLDLDASGDPDAP